LKFRNILDLGFEFLQCEQNKNNGRWIDNGLPAERRGVAAKRLFQTSLFSQTRAGELIMSESASRRRPPRSDTEQAALKRACARHLKDLKRAHKQAPADVRLRTGTPRFITPAPEYSYCTSPALLCTEITDEQE
jgi:hypothetical protein